MSISHSIAITISFKFNAENIENVLRAGSSYGFVYYDQTQEETYFMPPIISAKNATDLILTWTPKIIEDGKGYIYTRIDDTYLSLFIRNDEGLISLDFVESSFPWRKEFWNGGKSAIYDFDIARYVRVLLQTYSEFKIIKLVESNF